jgi:hypothetical protein
MKEQPILFSTEMVKAILEGRKTQTRRVVVAQTGEWKGKQPIDVLPMKIPNEWVGLMQHDPNRGQVFKCRYGQVGDKLWFKEAWATEKRLDHLEPSEIGNAAIVPLWYKADDNPVIDGEPERGKWRSGRFMPKWAARIWLEITKVRVEKLQEITEEDAKAEGCPSIMTRDINYQLIDGVIPTFWFEEKWNDLNTKRGYGWDSNCWVWVLEFKKVKP